MILIVLGAFFLLGLVADLVGRKTFLPRVTLLLVLGVIVGSAGLDLIPRVFVDDWFPVLTQFALSMVGFLLGQQLTIRQLRHHGRQVLTIALGKALGAACLVALALILVGVEPPLALILAGIATATAPAATMDVVNEHGKRSDFAKLLLGIVALDDALGLMLFGLLVAVAQTMNGSDVGILSSVGYELGGSLLLGLVVGVPMAYRTGRISDGAPTQAEAFGFVLVLAGVADWLHLSPILAAMMCGSVVGSLAKHHKRPFHAIEAIEWPFMILFFILAGASVEISPDFALVGLLVYIASRGVGTWVGAWSAARLSRVNPLFGRWLGVALMPQAGVALGMALLAAQRFPLYEEYILGTILVSTVVLEVASPIFTRTALQRTVGVPLEMDAIAR